MALGFLLYTFLPQPAIVQSTYNNNTKPIVNQVLVAKGCSEVRRWYAWTRCGSSTCCKLFIACSNGTIVTKSVNSSSCN